MIEFHSVTRRYGDKVAVDALNFTIAHGELFALLGHNGAGKTTTVKMLVGLLRPERGAVRIAGYDVTASTREASQLVGYVPDQPYLYDKLSGREFLQFVGEMHGLPPQEVVAAIQRESERFSLGPFLDDLTESYSHGMKQRTVFASALIHQPQVLVVDEPMVGLDPQNIHLVKDLLRAQASAGVSVLMSTHSLDVAEKIADRIGVMHRGRLIFLGTVTELRELRGGNESLEDLFLSLTSEANAQANRPAREPTRENGE